MSQTAEEQILAAAKQSIIDKTHCLQALDSEFIQALIAELQQVDLPELATVLEQLLVDELSAVFKGLSVAQLSALNEASAARLEALYPLAQTASIPQIQSLKLVDFDDEPDADESGFSLIDFDTEPETQPDSVVKLELREPLWLVNQLTAALYYVQFVHS